MDVNAMMGVIGHVLANQQALLNNQPAQPAVNVPAAPAPVPVPNAFPYHVFPHVQSTHVQTANVCALHLPCLLAR